MLCCAVLCCDVMCCVVMCDMNCADEGMSDEHARALSGLGVTYSALGQHQKAVEALNAARDICSEVFGEGSER